MPRVAIVTCLNLPEPDVDQPLLSQQLVEHDVSFDLTAWDDKTVDWASYEFAVIRSTWDYPLKQCEFKGWIEQVAVQTQLLNSPELVLPNLNKKYLLDLEQDGIAIVPTRVVTMDSIESALDAWAASRLVIKPAVGAGSFFTAFFDRADILGMRGQIAEIEKFGGEALIQPFMDSVPNGGERSLVWIDGEFTHKIVKQPRFKTDEESVSASVPIEPAERLAADRVMKMLSLAPLYARVDLIEEGGAYLLNELELIEPSLFLNQNPDAAERFVSGIKRRLS